MNATLSIKKKAAARSERQRPTPSTVEEFLYWKPEDGFKYEWNKGILEKTPKMITFETLHIVDNLIEFFLKIKPNLEKGGFLFTEPQTNTSTDQIRVPDMAYFDKKQIAQAAQGETPVPAFAIELISKNDKYNHVFGKLEEYFNAGVQVVWLIDPVLEKVSVYTSPEAVSILKGTDLCTADMAIPGYVIPVKDIFVKP